MWQNTIIGILPSSAHGERTDKRKGRDHDCSLGHRRWACPWGQHRDGRRNGAGMPVNIRRQNLSEVVYRRLKIAILIGSYVAHERLPTEHELADEFKVSRPVVREALSRLREQGFIQSRRGSGSFVKDIPREDVLKFRKLESLDDLRLCYEFRMTIEPQSARLAAARATKQSLSQIAQAIETEHAALKSRTRLTKADLDFHLAVATASGNRFFVTSLEDSRDCVALGIHFFRAAVQWGAPELDRIYDEHMEVLRAIEARDGERAAAAMRHHLQRAEDIILVPLQEPD